MDRLAAADRDVGPPIGIDPVRLVGSDALADDDFTVPLIGRRERLSVRSFDGYHRVFGARVLGFSSLACRLHLPRVRATSSPGRTRMSSLETLEVRMAEPDPRLQGRSLDRPRAGDRTDGASLELMGWVLGRESRAVAIEVEHGERVVRRIPLDHRRPDLIPAFPDAPMRTRVAS